MPSTCPMVASPPPIFRSPPPCRAAAHWSRIASPDVALGISSSRRSAGRRVRRARVAAATTPPGHSLPWLLPVHITGPRHMASCWGDQRWLGEVWLWHVAKWKSWDPARWECETVRGMICLSATLQLSDVNHCGSGLILGLAVRPALIDQHDELGNHILSGLRMTRF
jgi:hypothetical protein